MATMREVPNEANQHAPRRMSSAAQMAVRVRYAVTQGLRSARSAAEKRERARIVEIICAQLGRARRRAGVANFDRLTNRHLGAAEMAETLLRLIAGESTKGYGE